MRRYFRKPIPGDASDPDSLTALLERYLLWMETHHFAEGTVVVRRLTLSKFLLFCHQRSVTKAREVTREMIARYQRKLFYYRKRDGGRLSLSSQSHWLTALRSWFNWLTRERLIDHNPAAEMQALNRAHRIGQDKNVFVYRFISIDSIEEKIQRLQEKKSELAKTFVTSNNPLKHLSKKEVLELFA